MLKEVSDGLKLVAEGIKNIKTIVEAVKSGKDYIKTKHPEVQQDLRAMIQELGKSMGVVKSASSVMTHFWFAVSADERGGEIVRFNNYFMKSNDELQHLKDHIEDLRTHCSKIRKHGEMIGGEATTKGFTKVFTFLGLNSPQREQELGRQLDQLAYSDFNVANSAGEMLDCLEKALKDVQNALGVGRSMHSDNVPAAAALLAEYGPEFEQMEEQAGAAVKETRALAAELE